MNQFIQRIQATSMRSNSLLRVESAKNPVVEKIWTEFNNLAKAIAKADRMFTYKWNGIGIDLKEEKERISSIRNILTPAASSLEKAIARVPGLKKIKTRVSNSQEDVYVILNAKGEFKKRSYTDGVGCLLAWTQFYYHVGWEKASSKRDGNQRSLMS